MILVHDDAAMIHSEQFFFRRALEVIQKNPGALTIDPRSGSDQRKMKKQIGCFTITDFRYVYN